MKRIKLISAEILYRYDFCDIEPSLLFSKIANLLFFSSCKLIFWPHSIHFAEFYSFAVFPTTNKGFDQNEYQTGHTHTHKNTLIISVMNMKRYFFSNLWFILVFVSWTVSAWCILNEIWFAWLFWQWKIHVTVIVLPEYRKKNLIDEKKTQLYLACFCFRLSLLVCFYFHLKNSTHDLTSWSKWIVAKYFISHKTFRKIAKEMHVIHHLCVSPLECSSIRIRCTCSSSSASHPSQSLWYFPYVIIPFCTCNTVWNVAIFCRLLHRLNAHYQFSVLHLSMNIFHFTLAYSCQFNIKSKYLMCSMCMLVCAFIIIFFFVSFRLFNSFINVIISLPRAKCAQRRTAIII